MDGNKQSLSKAERQHNIDALIKGWKDRVRKMEEEKDAYVQRPEIQAAINRLKLRKSKNGGIVTKLL